MSLMGLQSLSSISGQAHIEDYKKNLKYLKIDNNKYIVKKSSIISAKKELAELVKPNLTKRKKIIKK